MALDVVSFDVEPGQFFALLGPNGAGKSTLVHILATILRPDGGRAQIEGHDVVREPVEARRRLGVVFQEPSLDDRLTVYENLDFHGMVYGVPRKLRRRRIEEMLDVVELADWRERFVRTLSSGMKRRLEIARTLIHDARVLILDEPTVGLDAQSRGRIWGYLERLRSERSLTVIVTTHYIEEVEGCDRVCIIDHGSILALDSPAGLKAAHGEAVLKVWPRDAEAETMIRDDFGAAAETPDGALLFKPATDAFVDRFLARHGARIQRMARSEPSLETVFLSLTGRELRDQAAAPRERTYAFGRRGGEHTR
nr:ABC transporter ATP-binding protein [Propylenella binzhouense]